MSNTTPRTRRAKPSGANNARRRGSSSTRAKASGAARRTSPRAAAVLTPPTAAIDVTDTMEDTMEDSVDEVVDLTCEASEASTVVDLTNNDSVLLVEEGPQNRRNASGESYVLSSDDEDSPAGAGDAMMSSLQAERSARWTPGTITCPVCMDSYSEMVDSGRLVVSTKCGHVFCSQCIRDALSRSHTCPTCRKRLTPRQYHPLYI
ncbi:E3 ubiquitin-protein ligase RNF4 [Nerophis lumbriciformis]|uniref:E3 ubiquitin-protein ligase RNF4 n=1 Tax=Nerophis lumbriciformis TaxID=546530 RepID=UPI002ADFBF6F|nr:E3 ubiquitin-protein ligase RNF4-like [Nerophis lumbriciformis]